MGKLFSDDFLRAVAQLRIVARQVPASGRHAEQRSRDCGGGMEFRDFRSYVPGDDLRRVDWNVYRRSGRLFLRLFEESEDLPIYVLLDCSDSMFFETPPRADVARQMAGLLAAISLGQHDRIAIYPFGGELTRPLVPTSGQRGLHAVLEGLEALRPAGPTNLVGALRRLAALPLRSGLVVVISDVFDPRGAQAVIDALKTLRHRLLLVQLTRRSDAQVPLDGEFTLVDCETGDEIEITATAAALAEYRTAYAGFCEQLLVFAARHRATHLRLDAEQPVLEQIGDLFRNRVFVP